MMVSFDDFAEEFKTIQRDLQRDYADGKGIPPSAMCKILHCELQLTETPYEEMGEFTETLANMLGIDNVEEELEKAGLDLTVEHFQLHELLMRVQYEASYQRMDGSQLLALMLIIGRRYGM